jgi:hypothetical protein
LPETLPLNYKLRRRRKLATMEKSARERREKRSYEFVAINHHRRHQRWARKTTKEKTTVLSFTGRAS